MIGPAPRRFAFVLAMVLGCGRAVPEARPTTTDPPRASSPEPRSEAAPSPVPSAPPPREDAPAARFPAPRRLVAIGDVHGDVQATRRALRIAGAIDASDRWVGGDLVVVQVGDLLDRGDDEPEILSLLDRLEEEASAAGGALHVLVGNHETMNAMGDFRYVTEDGFRDFANVHDGASFPAIERAPEPVRGRLHTFLPGGRWARWFASHPAVLVVGDTVFVHAGLHAADARRGPDAVNADVARFLASGEGSEEPALGPEGPLWTRDFVLSPSPGTCAEARAAVAAVGASRMVVGHTVQAAGITPYCDGVVQAIDVGLSRYYGGPTEVLVIERGSVSVLREPGASPAGAR